VENHGRTLRSRRKEMAANGPRMKPRTMAKLSRQIGELAKAKAGGFKGQAHFSQQQVRKPLRGFLPLGPDRRHCNLGKYFPNGELGRGMLIFAETPRKGH